MTLALADSPVRTGPLPSNRDHAELTGSPLIRIPPAPGGTLSAPTRSDALGDAAELRYAASVARYSHADWKREQHAQPARHDAMRYITIGWPSVPPPDVLPIFPSHKRPYSSDIWELAGERQLRTPGDEIVVLI